jgi:alcohol dehydrogenase
VALERYADAGRILAGLPEVCPAGEARAALVETLRDWVARLAVPGLSAFGMAPEDIPAVVADSPGSSMRTNPVALTDAELTSILQRSL